MKLSEEQERELFFYLKRELRRLSVVMLNVKVFKNSDESSFELFNLANSYFNDAKYFYEKNEFVKSFELANYCWGLLDALAISKALNVPKRLRHWFKAEF
ncbi:MAG: DUF357 domain-containing protein [Candidatus Woesearchaeota archaeon]